MGGTGSGGARQGQQGQVYTNRSDMAANRSPQQAQQVTPPPSQSPNPAQAQQLPPNQMPTPDELYKTQRPDEPVTAGLPNSPGAGPEVLPMAMTDATNMPISSVLQALAAQSGASDLSDLAEQARALGQ